MVERGHQFPTVVSIKQRIADQFCRSSQQFIAWQCKTIDEHAVAAYWVGRYKEAMALNQRLLSGKALPAGERARVQKNMSFCRDKVAPGKAKGR